MSRFAIRHTPPRHRPGMQKFLIEELVNALYQAFCQMRSEQQTTLLELGGTPEDRFELSCQIAERLYARGIGTYGARVVQMYLREGEIQAMFYNFLCDDREETIVKAAIEGVMARWSGLQTQVFRTSTSATHPSQAPLYLRDKVWRQEYEGNFIDDEPAIAATPTQPDSTPAVSEVPRSRRTTRRNVQQGRSKRDPRRTGRCDERPVSALLP